ncbi:hypothetical protein GGR57DRAFT_515446 [Xylariaceae sp. FL1272]|nr:hypothetical protein GGR57DRAFT_515446 [Xylariaceae sp. FL1272]
MPKSYGGGKTFRKAKTNQANHDSLQLLLKEDELQHYARVEKALGQGRYQIKTFSSGAYGATRIAVRRGSFRKRRVYINIGDIVLVALRDFNEDGACDIIHRYSPSNARELQKLGEMPKNALVDPIVNTVPDAKDVTFAEDDEDEDGENEPLEKVKQKVLLPKSEYYPDDDEEDEDELQSVKVDVDAI